MMDEAMRLSGASYLRAVLRPTLAAVLAERRPCEIDPARVKPSAAVTANLANLKDYVERVSCLYTIMMYFLYIPKKMKNLLQKYLVEQQSPYFDLH